VKDEERRYVRKWFMGDWFKPFTQESRCFVQNLFESLGFFEGLWGRWYCAMRRDCRLWSYWSDGRLGRWFRSCISSHG